VRRSAVACFATPAIPCAPRAYLRFAQVQFRIVTVSTVALRTKSKAQAGGLHARRPRKYARILAPLPPSPVYARVFAMQIRNRFERGIGRNIFPRKECIIDFAAHENIDDNLFISWDTFFPGRQSAMYSRSVTRNIPENLFRVMVSGFSDGN
jgi:hypothetical protein